MIDYIIVFKHIIHNNTTLKKKMYTSSKFYLKNYKKVIKMDDQSKNVFIF